MKYKNVGYKNLNWGKKWRNEIEEKKWRQKSKKKDGKLDDAKVNKKRRGVKKDFDTKWR